MAQSVDILIIGGGFAGLSCFRAIDRTRRKVNLLSNRNHFLFTPLLPLAATGAVEVRSIVEPLWSFQKNPGEIIIGHAVDLDPAARKLIVETADSPKREVSYRTLVLTIGAVTATYDIPGVEEHCHFFREMKDARALRESILAQFERATQLEGEARAKALRFVVVGGGATGVELACEINDLIEEDLKRGFPDLAKASEVRIIEAQKEILTGFDRTLAHYAEGRLRQKKIRLQTAAAVQSVHKHQVTLKDGQAVDTETIIWTAGIGPSSFLKYVADRVGVKLENGRLPVDKTLAVGDPHLEVYAIGDCASFRDPLGRVLPATAQVAMKQGVFLGRQLSTGGKAGFTFRTMGMLASLGTGSAIADLGFLRFKGRLAWWFWKAAYLTRLVSLRNKTTVAFDWFKVRFFGRNTARIEF